MSDIPTAELKPMILFSFDDRLSCKLPRSYIKLLMVVNYKRQLWVAGYLQTACFCNFRTDEKYEHVTWFLCSFLIWDLQRSHIFFQSSMCYFCKTWYRCTALKVQWTGMALWRICDMLKIKYCSRRMDRWRFLFLRVPYWYYKKDCTLLKSFADPLNYGQGCRVLWISRTHLIRLV